MKNAELTYKIMECAFRVHTILGPGLLESAYQVCLVKELRKAGFLVEVEVPIPVIYDGEKIGIGYRLDILVEKKIVIELKSIKELLPIHQAQVITYLKLGDYPTGLLLNFNVVSLTKGVRRVYNNK